jgi:hypothetical protein
VFEKMHRQQEAALSSVLRQVRPGLRINEYLDYPGDLIFRHACKMGLESIVSKRLGSYYRSGWTQDWLKFKNPEAPAVKREAEEDWTMKVIHGAQFELSVDDIPRSYRDRRDIALHSAQLLKSRNPNSVVKVTDLQSGEEIVIAFNRGEKITRAP